MLPVRAAGVGIVAKMVLMYIIAGIADYLTVVFLSAHI
jgi:hypothetical protein